MVNDLDAKGPHVHLDEHNPEQDNPDTQAAPQPGNDPSGIAARLFRLAQQLEDQHAPQHMTILMREASNRLSNHRTETLEYLAQVGQLSDELERLRAALHWVSLQHYTDQRTVTPEIAHQAYRPLIAHVNAICDKARAALEERT